MRYVLQVTSVAVTLLCVGSVNAAVVTIPQASLTSSTDYYTDRIGGGIGAVVVTTGGGNAANINDPSGRNDDGFRGPISLGFSSPLSFFGGSYNEFYVNTNGNVSFGSGISSFTPTGPQGAPQPIISPFFADVDTRGAGSGLVHLRQDAGTNQLFVTWDSVGYFGAHDDKLNSFQLVLRGSNYAVPSGEGQIGFFWKTMQWETGDASGGSGGLGGTPAAVGFGDGSSNGQVLEGSTLNGIAGVVQNHNIWFNLSDSGTPIVVPPMGVVPEPSTYALLLAGLGFLGFIARKRKLSA